MSEDLQLSLNIGHNSREPFDEENLVPTQEQQKVLQALDLFFAQQGYLQSQFPFLIIQGEQKSGKTHIVNIFAQKNKARLIDAKEIVKAKIPEICDGNKFVIVDNADQIQDQDDLFHIYNYCLGNEIFLLLTIVDFEVFKLADLISRLKNVSRVYIDKPSQDFVKILLTKGFAGKQLKIDYKIIDYLSSNISRRYFEIDRAINKVEQLCFTNKKTLTLLDVKMIEF